MCLYVCDGEERLIKRCGGETQISLPTETLKGLLAERLFNNKSGRIFLSLWLIFKNQNTLQRLVQLPVSDH